MVKIWLLISVIVSWSFMLAVVHLTLHINISRKSLLDLRKRVVSFCHGLFCLGYSITASLQGDELGSPLTDFQEICLTISAGYFIYDIGVLYLSDLHGTPIMIHHFSGALINLFSIYVERGGIELIYCYFIMECSNPFLHFKDSLKILNQQNTKIYLIAELAYFFCYFASRFGLGIPMFYYFIFGQNVLLAQRICSLVFEALVCYWAKDIISILIHRYNQYQERCEKGIELPWINGSYIS